MNSAAWTPPNSPDPSEILQSAVVDKREGRHEQALAKFLWFHHHALEIEPRQSGVRLSFAMMYWLDLASVYPPAKTAFVQTRDDAEHAFRESNEDFELFMEITAFNEKLGQNLRTADLFAEVAAKDYGAAQLLYHRAERYLIAVGRYRDCAPFLEPEEQLKSSIEHYRMAKRFEDSRPARPIPIPKFAKPHFISEIATLVALLVVNDRSDETKKIREAALNIVDDDDFRTILDAAMTGHFPERYI